jgi:hypothetical protein
MNEKRDELLEQSGGIECGQLGSDGMCGRRGKLSALVIELTVMQHDEPSLAFAR